MACCLRCILDEKDDTSIKINNLGICNYCLGYENIVHQKKEFIKYRESNLQQLINTIKSNRKGKYDCVIGISGGTDSSFLAYTVKQLGLNTIVIHVDNGWNSELSEKNIKNIVDILGFDFHVYKIDWEEFKDLQRAYIEASVVDIEVLTDHSIMAYLLKYAAKNKIKYILSGNSTFTEGFIPSGWVYQKSDSLNIKDIHAHYGKKKLKTIPLAGMMKRKIWYKKIKGIQVYNILDYIDYQKKDAQKILAEELNWVDYGQKHEESLFTKFYQSYILPVKFGIDKRKAHYSSLIRAGQMTREEAIELMKLPIIDEKELQREKTIVLEKLGYTEEEFDEIMQRPRVEHTYFKSTFKYMLLGSKIKQFLLRKNR